MRIGGLPALRLEAPVSGFLPSLGLRCEVCASIILGIGNRHTCMIMFRIISLNFKVLRTLLVNNSLIYKILWIAVFLIGCLPLCRT